MEGYTKGALYFFMTLIVSVVLVLLISVVASRSQGQDFNSLWTSLLGI